MNACLDEIQILSLMELQVKLMILAVCVCIPGLDHVCALE